MNAVVNTDVCGCFNQSLLGRFGSGNRSKETGGVAELDFCLLSVLVADL